MKRHIKLGHFLSLIEQGAEYPNGKLDKFLWIYQLPNLTIEQQNRQKALGPKPETSPKLTLVLGIDNFLVHCGNSIENPDFQFSFTYNGKEHTLSCKKRPGLDEFMEKMSALFEIVIFSCGITEYTDKILSIIDPETKWSKNRVYRDSAIAVEGNYVKELSVLNRNLAHVIGLDISIHNYAYNLDNFSPTKEWNGVDLNDNLCTRIPFLSQFANVNDIRPIFARMFRHKPTIRDIAKIVYLRTLGTS